MTDRRHLTLVDDDFVPTPGPDARRRDLEEVFDEAGYSDQIVLNETPRD